MVRARSALLLLVLMGCATRAERVAPGNWALPWQRTATLSGQVLDHKGAPLAGALVSFEVSYYDLDDRPCTVVTDSNGRFRVSDFPAHVQSCVMIQHREHAPYIDWLDLLRPDREYSLGAQLQQGVPLCFQVEDRNGRVLPSIEIDDVQRLSATSRGLIRARIGYPKFGPGEVFVGPGGSSVLLQFWPPTLQGVELGGPHDMSDVEVLFTIDPASGKVGPPDHPTWTRMSVSGQEVDWSDPMRMVMPWTLHAILTVTYPDGRPVVGAGIEVRNGETLPEDAVTDDRGQYWMIFAEPPDPSTLVTVTKGSHSIEFSVGDGSPLHRLVELPRGGDLEVQLYSDVPGLYHRAVLVVENEEISEADYDFTSGTLAIRNLEPGEFDWELFVSGDFRSSYQGTATIQPGRVARVNQVIEPLKVTSHRVRVIGPDGQVGSKVHIRGWRGDWVTDELGEATIDVHWTSSEADSECAPPNEVELEVVAPGLVPQKFVLDFREEHEIRLKAPNLRVTAWLDGTEVELSDFHGVVYEPHDSTYHPQYFWGEVPHVGYRIESLPSSFTVRPGRLKIRSERAPPVEIDLKPGETRTIELQIDRP